ncbi:MAG: TIR domain-containing protein [Rhizobiales bacterium]|nr:TIR domain-containing protein [Hyphomicrobiales bacterium]
MSDLQPSPTTSLADAQRLKVFISYSRADTAFADELVAGLEFAQQFAVTIDRQSIIEGEDWKKRLGTLIADSDTVVFVLSPDSAKSEICLWEVEEAWRLSKRILPVLARPIGPLPAPERLAALNYVRFDEDRSFMAGLNGLVRALNTDVEWLREHTRILARALEWQAAGRMANRMLSGSDIEVAKSWLARRPKDAPEVTDLHLAFIQASEQAEIERSNAERKRLKEIEEAQSARAEALVEREVAVKALSRRTTIGLFSAGGLTAAAAGFAWWGNDAERRFQQERQRVADAEERAIEEAINKEAMRTDIVGQLAAFAAAPDQYASDGDDHNSPYTQAMMDELVDQRSTFQAAMARASRKVFTITGSQRPFISTDLNGEIYLFRKSPTRRLKALMISCDRIAGFENYLLKNVENDARAWEKILLQAGFETQRIANPSREVCEAAIDNLYFDQQERRGDMRSRLVQRVGFVSTKPKEPPQDTLALVFYSGTGFVVEGDLFIGVVETMVASPNQIFQTAVNLTQIQRKLRERAAASIVVMDTHFNRIREAGANRGGQRGLR